MHDERDVQRLIDRLYAAAVDPVEWELFLDDLSDVLRSKMTVLMHHDAGRQSASVAVLRRADPEFLGPYEEYYSARNPFFKASRPLSTGQVFDESIVPDKELLSSEYYNDWMQPQDARYGAAIVAFQDGRASSIISTWRGANIGRMSEDEMRLLHTLRPHVQRSLQIHRRLAAAEERSFVSVETLDLVPFGILLLDDRGNVAQMNRAATEMAHRADGFRVSAGEIMIEAVEDAPRVRSLVAEALRTAAGEGIRSGGSTFVTRTSGGRPYHFVIAPLRAGVGRQTAGAVAVLISDPLSAIVLDPADLRNLYGLTGAETLLASQLLGGLDLTEAARRLGIAVSTARTHLKRIFAKTETRRQSELVALLLGGIIQRPEET